MRTPITRQLTPRGATGNSPESLAGRVLAMARTRVGSLDNVDVFILLNGALFVVMCALVYYERWVRFMGTGRITEFLVYATLILGVILSVRALVPRRSYPTWLLTLIQIGIVAGFAGGFVQFGESRLYDVHILGLRYDKYVHAGNSLIVALTLLELCRGWRFPSGWALRGLVLFAVLGMGAVWECAEFFVRATVPGNGVGGYHDTLGDLFANVAGGLLFLVVVPFVVHHLTGVPDDAREATA